MDKMIDGNSAAELANDSNVARLDAKYEHIEAMSELKKARKKFIKELLGNGIARTHSYPGNDYFLWDAIDNIGFNNPLWLKSVTYDGLGTSLLELADNDPDFIVEMFLHGRLEEFRPVITEQVEAIANSIFMGWDDE